MAPAENADDGNYEAAPSLPGRTLAVATNQFRRYSALARRRPRPSICCLPVIDPLGRFGLAWGVVTTLLDLTYTAFVVPASLAFADVARVGGYTILDFIGTSMYIVDIILEFQIGFVVTWDLQALTITDGPESARFYVRHGTFWIDAIAVAPLFAQVALLAAKDEASAAIKLVQLLKLLRLLRVVRIITRMGNVNMATRGDRIARFLSSRFNSIRLFAINIVLCLAMLVNLLACLWWWIARVQGLENSWVAYMGKPEIDLYNATDATRWLVCAYFAAETIATIGYGDITAQTTAEVGLVLLFMFAGVTFFGYIISSIGDLMRSSGEAGCSSELLMQMQHMEAWLRQQSFPSSLQRRIRRHFHNSWAVSSTARDADFYTALPSWLRVQVAQHMQNDALVDALLGAGRKGGAGGGSYDVTGERAGGVAGGEGPPRGAQPSAPAPHIEQHMKDELAAVLAEISLPVHLASGQRLYSVGDPATKLYLLDEGQLATPIKGQRSPTFDAPSVVGAAALFAGSVPECATRLHTVRAVSNCRLWALDCGELGRRLATSPATLLEILNQYTRMVINIQSRLATLPPAASTALRYHVATYAKMLQNLKALQEKLAAEVAAAGAAVTAGGQPAANGGGRSSCVVARAEEEDVEAAALWEEEEPPEVEEHARQEALRRRQATMSVGADEQTAVRAGVSRSSEGASYVG